LSITFQKKDGEGSDRPRPADPVCTAQILWINLVTNGLHDVAIAFEPGKKNIIGRKPRPPGEGIMSRLLISAYGSGDQSYLHGK
jgi:hypothetical protein